MENLERTDMYEQDQYKEKANLEILHNCKVTESKKNSV